MNILIRGSTAICYLSKTDVFQIDLEDIGILENHNWRIDKYGYVRSGHQNLLHRMILNPHPGMVVDHINGNPSDCRKINLRIGSQRQNSYNTRLGKNNQTGYKGVSLDRCRKKYAGCICVSGKTKHLGRYRTKEEAADAYDQAASFYFGEFAFLNSEIRKGAVHETEVLELGKK